MKTFQELAGYINDIIDFEMDCCEQDGVETSYIRELEHILNELKEEAKFLKRGENI